MKGRLPPTSVLLMAVLLAAVSLVPTIHGYLSESPPGKVFMGFRYMAGDHFQYAAFIRQAGETGSLLMENPFTTEPQRPSYLLLYFWVLGITTRLTGLSVTTAWEVFRVLGAFLYVILFWSITEHFTREAGRRVLMTALFTFAGGLDWIVTLVRVTLWPSAKALEFPYDYFWNWSTFGATVTPNWIWPAVTFLLACSVLLKGTRGRDLLTFVLLPIVWFLHPYSGMVAYLTFGLLPVMPLLVAAARLEEPDWPRVRKNFRLCLPAVLSFVVVAVYLVWARSDSVFRLNSARGFSWTSHFSIWWYPLSFGMLLPLAWYGMRAMARERKLHADLVFSWLFASVFLSVNPLYAGSKFHYLIFLPLVVLSGKGLFQLWDDSSRFRRVMSNRPAMAALGLLLFLHAPVAMVKDMPAAGSDREIYMSESELEAMRWLDDQPEGIVLSGYRAGNRIPWLAGKKVYEGHWFMTLNGSEKRRNVAYFLNPQVPRSLKLEILRKTRARYIYYGPEEASLGSIDTTLPLERVHENAEVVIYESDSAR